MNDNPSVTGAATRRPMLLISHDVFLLPRLQDAASALGFTLVLLEGMDEVAAASPPPPDERMLTEPLSGPDAAFIREVAELQPALILLDLSDTTFPVTRWLQRLKTSAATRRLPVAAFGPHVDKASLDVARRLGANVVVARSRLHTGLAGILQSYALPDATSTIDHGCQQALSALAAQGLELMQDGRFFEAHEVLERAWLESEAGQQSLYRALVQTCVTYLHLQRGNRRGAAKILLRIHQWLDPLPDRCSGLDVVAWKANLHALRNGIDALGPDSSAPIDPTLLRPIPRLTS